MECYRRRHDDRQQTTTDDDRRQIPKQYWPPTLCVVGGPVIIIALLYTEAKSDMLTLAVCELCRVFAISGVDLSLCLSVRSHTCKSTGPTLHYTLPQVLMRSIMISVFACLSVLFACWSARISQKPHVQKSPNFLYMLLVAVARSSSGGIAIRNVLPVSGMTMFPYNKGNRPESKMTRMFRRACQVAAPGRSVPFLTASC